MNETNRDDFIPLLRPDTRVWLKMAVGDDKRKSRIVTYGVQDELVYRGYTMIGTSTWLILNRIDGSGKRAAVQEFAVNAADCLFIGVRPNDERRTK